jgi:diguanylate cyclase (GGDEF)-like protein
MVADVLEAAGFDVTYLGADIPVESLRSYIAEHQPDVVGLTFGISVDVVWLADSLWAIHQVSPQARIMLGGRAVPPGLKSCYPFVASSAEVVGAVELLLKRPPPPVPSLVEALRSAAVLPLHPEHSGGETDEVAARWARAADDAVEVAREHVRRAQAYRNLAFRDSLTGLGNRRAFEDALSALTSSQVGGAVLMIDVDKFKAVNDGHGHAAGDELLRLIAQAIASAVRPGDTPARVGGDEFAVLLPRATVTVAAEVGERVRAAVIDSSPLRVSVSVGVSTLSEDPRAAMLSADVALYDAKSAGRDCVMTSHSGPIAPTEAA